MYQLRCKMLLRNNTIHNIHEARGPVQHGYAAALTDQGRAHLLLAPANNAPQSTTASTPAFMAKRSSAFHTGSVPCVVALLDSCSSHRWVPYINVLVLPVLESGYWSC
jgi:hypothetical protein